MKGNHEKGEVQAYIQDAVNAAVEAGMRGVDEKLQAAVNLGVSIGISVGLEIGANAGAEAGAAAAVKAMKREKKRAKKQEYDWKYHNTKLLLRNYRRLNTYYENAVFDSVSAAETDENFEDIIRSMGRPEDEEVFVESIQRNYIATRTIMAHVNKMLDCYEIMCERSHRQDDARHWRVLYGLYIADDYTTAEEIARQEHIDKRTVYRDIDTCAADLTALLFGVGGIERL